MEKGPKIVFTGSGFRPKNRSLLEGMLFSIPCSPIEKKWISYFYNKNADLRKKILQVKQNKLNVEDFLENLRQDIDEYILLYLQNGLENIKSPVSMVGLIDRTVIVRNFREYRDLCIEFFLAFQKGDKVEGDKALMIFRGKLRGEIQRERSAWRYNKERGKIESEQLVENISQLMKILFVRNISISRFKRDLAGDSWIKLKVDKILQQKNLAIQNDFIETFIREYGDITH